MEVIVSINDYSPKKQDCSRKVFCMYPIFNRLTFDYDFLSNQNLTIWLPPLFYILFHFIIEMSVAFVTTTRILFLALLVE